MFKHNPSSLCLRCGLVEGTFLHSIWQCSKVQEFWQGIWNALSTIHGVTLPMDPEICLLGNLSNSNHTDSHSIKLPEILLSIIKKKCIAMGSPSADWIVALISEQLCKRQFYCIVENSEPCYQELKTIKQTSTSLRSLINTLCLCV